MATFRSNNKFIRSQVKPSVVKFSGSSFSTDAKEAGIDLTPLEVLLQSILDQSDIETSGAGNTAVWFDNGGIVTKYYVRQVRNDETDTVIRTEYTNDGINWSTTAPTGTPSLEGPFTNTVLADINCATANPNVKECNSGAILTALETIVTNTTTSNTNELSIINELQLIKAETSAVNANTNTIEAKLDAIIADQLSGNITLVEIRDTLITDILPELQAINANTNTVEALIADTNTKLDTLIAEQNKNESATAPTKFHIGTTNYYARQYRVYDAETGSIVSVVPEYSLDGVIWTTTAPIGTAVIGWYVAPVVTPSTITPGGIDITVDLVNIGGNITTYGVPSTVKSLTLSVQENTDIQTNYGVKKLYADKAYTWNQGTNVEMDISSFSFITDNRLVEIIFDI